MTRALCVPVLVLSAVLPRPARADPATEAQFFDGAGRRAYEAARYDEALEAFLLVEQIAPSPRVLYNIAVSADLAGLDEVAFAQYREYLASEDPSPERRRDAERRAARLERKLAVLEVTSDPPGASIFVDRRELGACGVTPRTIAVESGEHQLILERPGYLPRVLPVLARAGARDRVGATLAARYGEVLVEVQPKTATLRLFRDDKEVAAPLERARWTLPVGPYTLVAEAPGYLPARASVAVREQGVERQVVTLVPVPRATGRLLVNASGGSADLYLDGRKVGSTPVALASVTVGEHAVEVRSATAVWSRRVAVRESHATYLEVDWKSELR